MGVLNDGNALLYRSNYERSELASCFKVLHSFCDQKSMLDLAKSATEDKTRVKASVHVFVLCILLRLV